MPNGNNITIAELLKMRSGLYSYTFAPEFSATLDADPTKVWTPQEVLAIAFQRPPESPPDTSYDYNNTNYALLGLIAEKVGGQPLAQQFQDRFFGPLGLQQTSLPAADDNSIPAPYSHGYMYGGTSYASGRRASTPPTCRPPHGTEHWQPIDYTNQNPSYATAAGGAISTADDLATWMRALVSGKVLNTDYQQQWLDEPATRGPEQPRWPEIRVWHLVSAFWAERLDVLPRG